MASSSVGLPQQSTYQQYKKNTELLVRWVVTTASACITPGALKPPKNNPKHKKKTAQAARTAKAFPAEISISRLVSLSTAIAEAKESVPDAIFALFDSVITARTAVHEIWKAIAAVHPDADIERSNEGHRAFIDALQSAYDTLGGALWRQKHQQDFNSKRKAKDEERSKALAKMKAEAGPEGVDPAFQFVNNFAGLEVESLTNEEEAELEQLVTQDTKPLDDATQPAEAKSKRKSKPRRATEPLENYKVKSETDIYFAICFFVRDVLNLRR